MEQHDKKRVERNRTEEKCDSRCVARRKSEARLNGVSAGFVHPSCSSAGRSVTPMKDTGRITHDRFRIKNHHDFFRCAVCHGVTRSNIVLYPLLGTSKCARCPGSCAFTRRTHIIRTHARNGEENLLEQRNESIINNNQESIISPSRVHHSSSRGRPKLPSTKQRTKQNETRRKQKKKTY